MIGFQHIKGYPLILAEIRAAVCNFKKSMFRGGNRTDFQSANIYMLFLINLPIIFCKPFNGKVFAEKRNNFEKAFIL